jgi:hypothetical protein
MYVYVRGVALFLNDLAHVSIRSSTTDALASMNARVLVSESIEQKVEVRRVDFFSTTIHSFSNI